MSEVEKQKTAEKAQWVEQHPNEYNAAMGNNGVVKTTSPVSPCTEKPFVLSEAEKRAEAEKIAMEQSKTLVNQKVPATTVNTNSPYPIVAKAIDKSKVVNVNATKADPNDASKKLQSNEK